MKKFIIDMITVISGLHAIVIILVIIAWLFDCKPTNLYMVWGYCLRASLIWGGIYLLFISFERNKL